MPKPAPPQVRCRDFLLDAAQPGDAVLDVGCGDGDLLSTLVAKGCRGKGVEIDDATVAACRDLGLDVVIGAAESLPFDDASFDVVVASVVLPYTDETRAVAEIARVLKPNGIASVTGHGFGYPLSMMKRRGSGGTIYAARMLVNTVCYRTSRRRLPGFWGDTICHSFAQMRRDFATHGMGVERRLAIGQCFGLPRFVVMQARKGTRGNRIDRNDRSSCDQRVPPRPSAR